MDLPTKKKIDFRQKHRMYTKRVQKHTHTQLILLKTQRTMVTMLNIIEIYFNYYHHHFLFVLKE